ncbi:hypothetical protein [Nocardiopsis rhodophaea]|uniref:hypothetical protein n=1 Tax=Nocardiopsis rhodophaea TaxID=280238 RepID=UPI0031D397D0
MLPVFLGIVGTAFAAAMDRPALTVMVRDHLHASTLWYGLALAAIAVGAMAPSRRS